MGRSVHPTTLFLGSRCGISRGEGGEDSDISVLYVGADHFWGVKTLNFNTFLGFHEKKINLFFFFFFFWGGGMEKLLLSVGAITNWAILGVISVHFRAF